MSEPRQDDRIRHFPCDGCGADLAYRPGDETLGCSYCGFTVDVHPGDEIEIRERDLAAALARQAERRSDERPEAPETLEVRCPSCNAEIIFRGTLTSQRCAYCTGPIQRTDVHRASDRIPVDSVLPFVLEDDEARAAVGRWLRGLWFAPKGFSRKHAPEDTRGVFVPYWTFDALTSTRYRGRAKRAKETFWKKRRGVFQWVFDDLMVVADSSLDRSLMRALAPWPMDRSTPYDPKLLTGRLARTYDVGLVEGWKRARQRIERAIEHEVRSRIGGDSQRIDELTTRWDAASYKHVLCPVFLLSIPHGRRVHRVVVNGATGEVSGSRPWSVPKLVAAAVTAIVALRLGHFFASVAGLL